MRTFVVTFLVGLGSFVAAGGEAVDLFVMTGQSNMQGGQADTSHLTPAGLEAHGRRIFDSYARLNSTTTKPAMSEPKPSDAARLFPVRDFGAAGDGVATETAAIQAAVDACSKAGGGAVVFGPGKYVSGTIFLKDNVTLRFEKESVLLGSKNLADYPVTVQAFRSYTDEYTDKSLIYGEKLRNIAIEGAGTLDGRGASFKYDDKYKNRPYLMRLVECRGVSVSGVTFKDSAMWMQHYLACEDVTIRGITVRSRCNVNNDGIDIDGCTRVRISGCDIVSGDDSICLKSTSDRACEDVQIEDCVLSSKYYGIKMGTESNGGFKNVRIRRCRIYDTGHAGLGLMITDGGTMDGIEVDDLVMERANGALFIVLGDRNRPYKKDMKIEGVGTLKNVTIRNIRATGCDKIGCAISGLPGHLLENIRLSRISIEFAGGGTQEDARRAMPDPGHLTFYPEYKMFGTLPAYGFLVRHVRGISFEQIALRTAKPDARPPFVFSDVKELAHADIEAPGWVSPPPAPTKP